jgi:hypothetical protein
MSSETEKPRGHLEASANLSRIMAFTTISSAQKPSSVGLCVQAVPQFPTGIKTVLACSAISSSAISAIFIVGQLCTEVGIYILRVLDFSAEWSRIRTESWVKAHAPRVERNSNVITA